ncbi:MAG: hypothetical protein ACRDOD_23340, partial [Streptosporangiaceae bacterium]
MNTSAVAVLGSLVLLFPVAGALINALAGRRLPRGAVNLVGTLSILAAFLVACLMLAQVVGASGGKTATVHLWQWIDLG